MDAEVDEAAQVDGGASVSEADLVAGDASVADLASASANEPGNGSFDHWTVAPVGLLERVCERVSAGRGEEIVVFVDAEDLAVA